MQKTGSKASKAKSKNHTLQDILNCQAPPPLGPTSSGTGMGVSFTLDLPWQSNIGGNAGNGMDEFVKPQMMISTPHDHDHHHQQQQHVDMNDDQVDSMDLFASEQVIDYETMYKTQPGYAAVRGLHMNSRERENLETYRLHMTHASGASLVPGVPGGAPTTVTGVGGGGSGNGNGAEPSVPEHFRIIDIPMYMAPATSSMMPPPAIVPPTVEPRGTEFFHPMRMSFYSNHAYHTSGTYVLDDEVSWPMNSPFACWWCCHTFSCYPKVVPVSIRGKEVEVMGNFCSWNCAKSYSIRQLKSLELFHTLFQHLFRESSEAVVPAPSPICLKLFGGAMDIDEYRRASYNPDRRVSLEVFSHLHITMTKSFVFDSKYTQNQPFLQHKGAEKYAISPRKTNVFDNDLLLK